MKKRKPFLIAGKVPLLRKILRIMKPNNNYFVDYEHDGFLQAYTRKVLN